MSINYELSLWREFPGAAAIQEEKVCIIADSNMDLGGRAQDIKLKKEYNGRLTLTFDIPVKYFDINDGTDKTNPLISQVLDQSKLKLWRDERWWNPFAVNKGVDEDTGCTIFEGDWVQGRWYDFIVTQHKEKRSKRKLLYSYTCDSLFMTELSRTGYNLEFVPDTDIMSANGMGTAHDLAKRIIEGTDWKYVKTEVFPDYKEEFNEVTGETVRVPVSTDQIEFSSGLERYVYCYTLKITDAARQQEILKELNDNGAINGQYGFDSDGVFWWKLTSTDLPKKYIYGYNKTSIVTSYADKILCYTSGAIVKNTDSENPEYVEEATLLDSNNLWEVIPNTCLVSSTLETDFKTSKKSTYSLSITNTNSGNWTLINSGYSDKPFNKGEPIVINVIKREVTVRNLNLNFMVYEGNPNANGTLAFSHKMTTHTSKNCFENSYLMFIPKQVTNPYIAISGEGDCYIDGFFVYKFVGVNESVDEDIRNWYSSQGATLVALNTANLSFDNATDVNFNTNTMKLNNVDSPIWLPVGTMAQNNFKNGIDVYCIEFNDKDGYKDIYFDIEENEVDKITSYNTDKRRAISGNKSNRYTLLETVSKTFFCFSKFLVEHDEQGYIKTDSAGRPLKYFTLVSELGRRQFNGFNYGVNLEGIERTIDSKSLVTKVYVENIDNQYTDSGVVSIQNSSYNKLGERFFYNFNYYARQGFFEKSRFLQDYQEMADYVGTKNSAITVKNEDYIAKEQLRQSTKTSRDTHQIQMSALKKEAEELLASMKWQRVVQKMKDQYGSLVEFALTFPNIDWSKFGPAVWVSNGEDPGFASLAKWLAEEPYDANSLNTSEYFLCGGLPEETISGNLHTIDATQINYNHLKSQVETENKRLEELTAETDKLQKEQQQLIDEKNKKITWFENKYHRYILEGQWSGNDYIEPDTYYLDATRAMSTSCMPKVSYTTNVIDLSHICNPYNADDTNWGEDFIYDTGDTTYVKDYELFGNTEQKAMISDITSYIDVNKPDDITLRNFETRFEELFQSIAAAVTTLQLNENIYSRAENFTAAGAIDETILQKSFADNKNLVISSANNQVSQDNYGITIRDGDGTGELLRAIAGGIFLSNDNGRTYTAGLTAKGFNASLITAGQIDTSKIVIRSSETPQYTLDTMGLTAYSMDFVNDELKKRDNSFVRFDQFGIYMTDSGNLFRKDWWKNDKIIILTEEIVIGEERLFDSGDGNLEIFTWLPISHNPENIYGYTNLDTGEVLVGYHGPDFFTLGLDWVGNRIEVRYSYIGKNKNYANNYISENSIFSLTRKGLVINSGLSNNNTYGGSIKITTEVPRIESYDKDGNIRVRMGYIRDDGNRQIYGLDVYDGAIRIYNDNGNSLGLGYEYGKLHLTGSVTVYDGDIRIYGNDKNNPSLYFDTSGNITLNGLIKREYSFSGSYNDFTYSGNESFGVGENQSCEVYWEDGSYWKKDYVFSGIKLGDSTQAINSNGTYNIKHGGNVYFGHLGDLSTNTELITQNRSYPLVLLNFDSSLNSKTIIMNSTASNMSGSLPTVNLSQQSSLFLGATTTGWIYSNSSPGDIAGLGYIEIEAYGRINNSTYEDEWASTISIKANNIYNFGSLYSNGSSVATTSDVNKKHNINPFSEKYSILFDNLQPVTYMYNDGTSGRLHSGFIAQGVKNSMDKAGLSTQEFAGLVIDNPNTENESWYLRYEEFISLNTWQIQQAKSRISNLETEIAQLKSQLASLTNS